MSDMPLWITDIGRLALGKPVLLVEGEDDVVLFEHFRHGSESAPGGRKHLYKFGWPFGYQAGEQNTCSETQAMV
jgi:hypothetical protein